MQRRGFLRLAISTFGVAASAVASRADDSIRMRDLYNKDGSFSELALARDQQEIVLEGFMAPPLKVESRFFVLTKMPMSVCPFCESEAEWPSDIVSIYSRDVVSVTPFNVPIHVSGKLELGMYRDVELGFVSRVRVTDARHWRV